MLMYYYVHSAFSAFISYYLPHSTNFYKIIYLAAKIALLDPFSELLLKNSSSW